MKTIKTLFLVMCIIAIASSVNAQNKLGLRAGWNSASVSGDDLGNTSSYDGVYFGVYKELNVIPKTLYINPELQYSKQGFKSDFAGSEESYYIDYINVPVLAKVFFLKIVSIEAGPQFAFKIGDNFTGENVETFDMQAAAGIGLNLPLGLSIDARYFMGFNEIFKNSDVKNEIFQLGVGFKF